MLRRAFDFKVVARRCGQAMMIQRQVVKQVEEIGIKMEDAIE